MLSASMLAPKKKRGKGDELCKPSSSQTQVRRVIPPSLWRNKSQCRVCYNVLHALMSLNMETESEEVKPSIYTQKM